MTTKPAMNIDGDTPRVDRRTKAGRAAMAAAIPTADDAKAVAAAVRASRPATRQPVREPTRAPSRRGAQVEGRNGEILSRKRTSTNDIFHMPPELIPAGWDYQWCAVTVVGNSEILMDQNLMMAENGWRPVPADRYPGRFMPEGHGSKPIVRGGQMLMERPKSLSDEARAEDIANARRLITDRDQSLMGGKAALARNIPEGAMDQRYRGTGASVRMSIDPALDIPSASYEVDESGE